MNTERWFCLTRPNSRRILTVLISERRHARRLSKQMYLLAARQTELEPTGCTATRDKLIFYPSHIDTTTRATLHQISGTAMFCSLTFPLPRQRRPSPCQNAPGDKGRRIGEIQQGKTTSRPKKEYHDNEWLQKKITTPTRHNHAKATAN